MQNSHSWVHKSTFILATAGAAIGLGNIWKFPYLVGQNGGGAFVLIYLICVFLIGLPLIITESIIGRNAKRNPVDAVLIAAKSSGLSPAWSLMSISGMISLMLIFSFFSVIGGWTLSYAIQCFAGVFRGMDSATVGIAFNDFLTYESHMICMHIIFAAVSCFVVMFGVASSLERGLRLMMPLLFILILGMLIYSFFFTDQFAAAARFMFVPDFSKLNPKAVLAAMGQAFFSLNVAVCVIMAYASYTDRSVSLVNSAVVVGILDTLVAIAAGLIIFPIVFTYGMEPAQGPGLFFVSLTSAFAQMPGGNFIGGLFFLLVAIAALTSSISMLEAPLSVLEQKTGIARIIMTPLLAFIGWFLGLATVFSFGRWSELKLLNKNAFEWVDALTSGIMMPLTGLALLIFIGWRMSELINLEQMRDEPRWIYDLWLFTVRYIAPVAVAVLFVYGFQQYFLA